MIQNQLSDSTPSNVQLNRYKSYFQFILLFAAVILLLTELNIKLISRDNSKSGVCLKLGQCILLF